RIHFALVLRKRRALFDLAHQRSTDAEPSSRTTCSKKSSRLRKAEIDGISTFARATGFRPFLIARTLVLSLTLTTMRPLQSQSSCAHRSIRGRALRSTDRLWSNVSVPD